MNDGSNASLVAATREQLQQVKDNPINFNITVTNLMNLYVNDVPVLDEDLLGAFDSLSSEFPNEARQLKAKIKETWKDLNAETQDLQNACHTTQTTGQPVVLNY